MLTRVQHALDWETGVELSNYTLGQGTRLQLHHIFPKSLLYAHGYNRRQVNQIANFTFLTQATNRFLNSLDSGIWARSASHVLLPECTAVPGGIVSSEEEQLLLDVNIWVTDQGLPEGICSHELVDKYTGERKVALDLAWPEGLQEGYSQPVVLIIDEDQEVEVMANQAGFRFFTTPEDFKTYVQHEILASV